MSQELFSFLEKMSAKLKILANDIDVFLSEPYVTGFNGEEFALFAEKEASRGLEWTKDGPLTKYTRPFEKVFGKGRFSWCACFVHWCLNHYRGGKGLGLDIRWNPVDSYTFALCEYWQSWAINMGFYLDNHDKSAPIPGDLVLFDWNQKDLDEDDNDWEDHMGIFVSKCEVTKGNVTYKCAEGNVGNKLAVKLRKPIQVQGFIRIPKGWTQDN